MTQIEAGLRATYAEICAAGFACGHPVPPFEEVFPDGVRCNYASVRNDAGEEVRICVACAFAQEAGDLLTHDKICQYLSCDGKRVTGFLGNELMRVTYLHKASHNLGCRYLWRLNAVDVHGQAWWGTSPGPGVYCRLRKGKGKRR